MCRTRPIRIRCLPAEENKEAARSIEKETGKKVTLINPRFASGLDEKLLSDLKKITV